MPATQNFPIGSNENLLRYEEKDAYHLLMFTSPPDNRFSPEFAPAFIQAITWIQTECEPKPLVTTSSTPKFYSNGLDFERAVATPGFFNDAYYPMMRVMLEFPWPTVAWVNGHAFAAGFMISACHDYIVMNGEKGYLCMNELEFGAPLLPPMMSIFRVRYGTQLAHKIALTAHRFTGKEALSDGLITALGALPEVEAIVNKVSKFAGKVSYGAIRKELFREVLNDTLNYNEDTEKLSASTAREEEFYEKIVNEYRAKL